MLKSQIKLILNEYAALKDRLNYNYKLFDSYEGNLLEYIIEDIKKQISLDSFKSMEHRIVAINFLRKLVDKLSHIYSDSPRRTLTKPNEGDQKLFDYYKEALQIDVEMQLSNEIFNLEKYVAIEPYIDDVKPALRVIQPDKFFVMSLNSVNPTKVTHYIKIMGKDGDFDVLHVYTDSEFLIINTNGDILLDQMAALNNTSGINPIGKIPAIYITRSKFDLIPRSDTDLFKMVKILPILFSDLNEVVFWQSFGIIYGIDLDAENLERAPNSFWNFKSDPNLATKPEIGQVKPQTDITEVQNFIMFQLNTWLDTRGIKTKSASSGQVNDASGLSKLVDELDTAEDRKKQVPFFKSGEQKLWDLVMNYFHPYWVKNNLIDFNEVFTPKQGVNVEFKEQFGIIDPIKTLDEIERERRLGIITRKRALLKKNVGMTDAEADAILKEIDEENTIEVDDVDEDKNQDS